MAFNPLDYPIAFAEPRRMSPNSAWVEHIPFAFALMQMARPRTLVELGTHHGDSYLAMCQAISTLKLDTRCYAIDTWQGDAHAGLYTSHVLNNLRQHHDPLYSGFSTLIQSTFDAAISRFADGSIDLLHIDGFHTYDACRHDFDTWLPKLSDRAVVLFHDTHIRDKDFGVWKVWEEVSAQYPGYAFDYGCGLGILAVGAHVPTPVMDFIHTGAQDYMRLREHYRNLGVQTVRLRNFALLCSQLFQTQQLINAWRQQTSQPITPGTQDSRIAMGQPHQFAANMANEMGTLIRGEMELRRAVASLEQDMLKISQMLGNPPSDAQPDIAPQVTLTPQPIPPMRLAQ